MNLHGFLSSAQPAKLSALALAALAAISAPALAQNSDAEQVTITGTRIKSLSLVATSPVAQIGAEQIGLWRAQTVEDFSVRLPQLAGGVNGTSAGSDAFGAQTLDLRALGQNRTLVLINGTRAVPFSIRNAVDVNFIPATLIKRVDVLTGGAAAVYGADAVSGVVNFVMNDTFEGLQAQAGARAADGGGSQYSMNLTGGMRLGNRGNIVGYVEYTKREGLLAGDRNWALQNPTRLAGIGGNFTDVVSGRFFAVDDAGNVATTRQTTDFTPQFTLVMPLERINASSFFKLGLAGETEAYGRVMFSNVKTTGAPRSGQAPVVINGPFSVAQTNPFIPAAARSLLTFVNGAANVNIERSLGELGVKTAENDRDTWQAQLGLRGALSANVGWDAYVQTGRSTESILVYGDGVRSRLPGLINTVDLFGPGADLSSLAQTFKYGDRERTQTVVAATLSGDSTGWFKLPAGAVGFALGAERRHEKGRFDYNAGLGESFNQGVESPPPVPPFFKASDVYAEVQVPLLAKMPAAKSLTLEGAYRRSSYDKSVGASNTYDSDKLGLNWAINNDVAVRATQQKVIREPNFGEFANPVFSIPFANLVNVARLRPRYQGDPCVLGTGNAEQCRRFAPNLQPYNSLDGALLTGGYFFGGNPEIRAEKGKTTTLGLVLTPGFAPGLSVTVDYYKIRIADAVGQIQPVDALSSCYITDPRADNPLCAAVTRDATTGRIKDGFPVDRNLALIQQEGYDIDARWRQPSPFGMAGHTLTLQYQASIVKDYLIQRSPVLDPVDCKGRYGFRCSSDAVSLVAPDYRHRAAVGWQAGNLTAQLGWKRIGKVLDSTVGSAGSISAQNYLDLNVSWRTPVKGLTLGIGIDNLTDKAPPTPLNPSTFNTFADTYDVLGRTVGVTATMKF
jgi:iron complex outermembrane recepter protein